MALDIIVTTNRISSDPVGRDLVAHLRREADALGLNEAVLYYDFPTYADYETVAHRPDALLLSPRHGIIAIRVASETERGRWSAFDESLNQFCSILIGRLLKSRSLRASRSTLDFGVVPLLFLPGAQAPAPRDVDSEVATSFDGLERALERHRRGTALVPDALAEARSVVEGAKALVRPQKRSVPDPVALPFAAALSALEAEIANFDQQQRRAAIVTFAGPQRIRGLAGSGKTVILAMKAAHLHLTRPDDRLLITFYTKSLRNTLTTLITKFYRHYKDEEPDWDHIHIRHGWGSGKVAGVYADACRRQERIPLTFMGAKSRASGGDPFDFACRTLLQDVQIEPYYDHVLIDEGQDFPSGFYELCYALTKGQRNERSIIWAYDELQNLFNVTLRSPEQLFGTDADGQPRVSLDRSADLLPAGATNDTVLSKCYRNQREVLVVAHALGFGIYGHLVQLLESRDHWQDVGYEVISGNFEIGRPVRILRPAENSPSVLASPPGAPLIAARSLGSFPDEVTWIANGIQAFLRGGLNPDDVLVVCLDDVNARMYFRDLSAELASRDVSTNNIIAPYTEPPFSVPGHVTLSTVYRAKGNETAVVFAAGVDAVAPMTRSGRNKLFTAFTRAKGWLRVSGVGPRAMALVREIEEARKRFPHLEFRMPDLRQVELIQRDLSAKQAKLTKIKQEYVKRLKDEGFSDEELDTLGVEVKDGVAKRSERHS